MTVNYYEIDISGSSEVLSNVVVKKTKETKGSSIIYWLMLFLGLSCLVMDRVRGCLGRFGGLGSKLYGFRPKTISKKPIIHLKPVCKSSVQDFKLVFRSSLQAQRHWAWTFRSGRNSRSFR